jgi:hypothetical protein
VPSRLTYHSRIRKRGSISPSKSRSRSPQKTPEQKKEYQRSYYRARKERKNLDSMSPPTLCQQFMGGPAPPVFGGNSFYGNPAHNFNITPPVGSFFVPAPGNGYMSSFPNSGMTSGVVNPVSAPIGNERFDFVRWMNESFDF